MSKHAFVFPGQGAQFTGMGKDLYEAFPIARQMMEQANEILGFRITDIMFDGDSEALKETKVTQPAIFLHSVVSAACCPAFKADMVAGHSLGELSALTAAGALSFEDGVRLVQIRAEAMNRACSRNKGTMSAVIGLDNWTIEKAIAEIDGTVVVANYNCPGQTVISGEVGAVQLASEKLKAVGARRVLPLAVSGAFHSPLMLPAREEFAKGIEMVSFHEPQCPIYQNVSASATTDPVLLKTNLFRQLTHSVKWMQSVQAMVEAGCTEFTEAGPGAVLQGLIRKTIENPDITVNSTKDLL